MKKLFALLAMLPGTALADTGYYMVTTYDVEGQTSLDYKYWNAHHHGATLAAPELGVGYGVTARWYTELYATWYKVNGGGAALDSLSWQNDYLLTQGQYDVDVALHTRIERPRERAEGYALEIGPVLQTEIGRTQFNANLFFQRDVRGGDNGPTQLTYQLQVRQRWKGWLQPGVQAFGEVGKWDHWLPLNRQSHRAGPALFGGRTVGGHELKYEAAYLFGRNNGRAAKSFTMRLQYVF